MLTPIRSANPWTITTASWRVLGRDLAAASGPRQRLGLLFRPPGWAPNGAGLTTRQMQAAGVLKAGAPLA